jgi:hypothetical protein
LLANSSDPEGYVLNVDGIGAASDGSVAGISGGMATYTPWGPGTDSFTFTVENGFGEMATGTAVISVSGAASPNVNDVSATATVGSPITIDLLAGASDPQGNPLSVDGVSGGSLGTVVDNGDGTITYTPTSAGTDTIQFSVTNGQTSTTANVTIQVADANPIAGDVAAATSGGAPVTINLLGNSSDPGGLALSVASVGQGSAGSVTQIDSGDVVYTPSSAATGTDSFTFTVTNAQGLEASATVYLTLS